MAIDWSFISILEGHRLTGYVPDALDSQSGVTVADGVDLGQMGQVAFAALDADLRVLLLPYAGLKKQDAADALAKKPLVLTEAQADALNAAVRVPLVRTLSIRYGDAAAGPFESIPDACQTVIASVTFQYGTPWIRCPMFWAAACRQDWPGVIGELENFGDSYHTRRVAESAYLKARLGLIDHS